MKSVVFILNGAAEPPLKQFEGKTPLDSVRAESMNSIAVKGQGGILVPDEIAPSDQHRLLAELLGVPSEDAARLARGPLLAAAAGADTGGFDYAYCANLVSVSEERLEHERVPGLSLQETASLCQAIQERIGASVRVLPVGPARAVFICRRGDMDFYAGEAPVMLRRGKIKNYFSAFRKPAVFPADWMRATVEVLEKHPVNEVRADLGECRADLLWLWGGGSLNDFAFAPKWSDRFLMTDSPIGRGLAVKLGMPVLSLRHAWQVVGGEPSCLLPETVDALRRSSFLFVYAEAPGALGTFGSPLRKRQALEGFSQAVVRPMLEVLSAFRPYKVMLVADGVVSSEERQPVRGGIPFVIAGDGVEPDGLARWSEHECAENGTIGRVTLPVLKNMIGSGMIGD